jgi:hypothetical protein
MIFRIFTLLEKIFNEKGVADIVDEASMMNTDTIPMSCMQKPTITTFLIIFFFSFQMLQKMTHSFMS